METIISFGRFPGEWNIKTCDEGWSTAAREVHKSMDAMAGPLYSDLCSWYFRSAIEPTEVLKGINDSLQRIQRFVDAGWSISEILLQDADDASWEGIRTTLGAHLDLAAWLYASAQTSLSLGDLHRGTLAFGHSMRWYGVFRGHIEHLREALSAPPSGAAHALSCREDQVLLKSWVEHCRRVVDSGIQINTLDDLLNVNGYDLRVIKIKAPSLRKAAREKAGINFKRGRPKI